jgi:hypothetical protein
LSWFSFNGFIYLEDDMSEDLNRRSLREIAIDIRRNFTPMYYAAAPYAAAMLELDTMQDSYGQDSAKSIVLYFLGNAHQWRGPIARAIKAELKGMLK